jgi:hypothetical protein
MHSTVRRIQKDGKNHTFRGNQQFGWSRDSAGGATTLIHITLSE